MGTIVGRFDSGPVARKSTHVAKSPAADRQRRTCSVTLSMIRQRRRGEGKRRHTYIYIYIYILYSPERPPDVEAHRVQPEERGEEEEVSHDC